MPLADAVLLMEERANSTRQHLWRQELGLGAMPAQLWGDVLQLVSGLDVQDFAADCLDTLHLDQAPLSVIAT
jgi:hypothetical protein